MIQWDKVSLVLMLYMNSIRQFHFRQYAVLASMSSPYSGKQKVRVLCSLHKLELSHVQKKRPSWFKSILFHCNEEWSYNSPLFQLLMRIHGRSSGKPLSFKQEPKKFQINSNKSACKECSSLLLCALLTFNKLCLLSLSFCLLCSLFVLPSFALIFHCCCTFKST